ncbi:hypothetical protein [Streptomyces aureocirculatus]|uniref:hypothetical protein n=1 Tax=Streptomyces aureocirculatus TaxID=67275 RepID=UPI0012FEB965|nr:hypothetical protein [Streptomyces aureocirculatus]
MNRTVRSIVIAATLSLAAAACTAGGGDGDRASSPPKPQGIPLRELDEVALNGDPMATVETEFPDGHARPVGEVRFGEYRVVAYVTGKKCGISVFDAKKSETIGLRTAWPRNLDEGSAKLPGGPYYSSSAQSSVRSGPWASLSCGTNSMIIEYESKDSSEASPPNGSASVQRSAGKRTHFVVIGSKDVRARILKKLS